MSIQPFHQELYQNILVDACNKELKKNEQRTNKLLQRKAQYTDAQGHLDYYLKSVRVAVMIPLGRKAFFQGHIIHTNDIMAYVGEDYYIKMSATQTKELCQRRLEACDLILAQLKTEKELLESRKDYRFGSNIFDVNQGVEIVEPYHEEEELQWREKHKENVKRQKQLERDQREIGSTQSEGTYQAFLDRLNALELVENMSSKNDRELSILEMDDVSSEGSCESEETEEDSDDFTDDNTDQIGNSTESNELPTPQSTLEGSIINFKHSNASGSDKNIFPKFAADIKSPTELKNFLMKGSEPTIKKRVSFAIPPELDNDLYGHTREEKLTTESTVMAVAEIVREATGDQPVNKVSSSRPLSKFKEKRK